MRKNYYELASRFQHLEEQFCRLLRTWSDTQKQVDALKGVLARLDSLEPAVFPDEARKYLAREVRYIASDMSDDEVTALFRTRKVQPPRDWSN